VSALEVESALLGHYRADEPRWSTPLFSLSFRLGPVDIDAPAALVWSVLVDFERYADWNPMVRAMVLGAPGGVGSPVDLDVSWGPYRRHGGAVDVSELAVDLSLRETLTIWESGRALAYADDRGALHRAERLQLLEPPQEGTTRYHNVESMVGVATPLVRLLAGKIQRGLDAAGQALKWRCETIHGTA
jgi:hypothetical protein